VALSSLNALSPEIVPSVHPPKASLAAREGEELAQAQHRHTSQRLRRRFGREIETSDLARARPGDEEDPVNECDAGGADDIVDRSVLRAVRVHHGDRRPAGAGREIDV
jgi:hypothetical protein